MEAKRLERFKAVVGNRQLNLTVILENVHDPHNIGAVMRSCDAVGIGEIYVLYTDPRIQRDRLELGKRTSAGTRRWIDVHLYNDPGACFQAVRNKYQHIYSTHLSEDAVSLYELELSQSVALLFGNEHEGVSPTALSYSDGNFLIPQAGMVQSLNISVACAISLFEAFRQRRAAQLYEIPESEWTPERHSLLQQYIQRQEENIRPEYVKAQDPEQ